MYAETAIVQRVRQALPDVQAIYLFGSQASGRAREQSDIDIAVLPADKLDAIARWELAELLARQLGRDIDLVDLLAASTVMRMEIIRNGKLLFETHQAAQRFEMTTLSMYQHLQRERLAIIDDFQRKLIS